MHPYSSTDTARAWKKSITLNTFTRRILTSLSVIWDNVRVKEIVLKYCCIIRVYVCQPHNTNTQANSPLFRNERFYLLLASVLRHEERDTILTMLTILLSVIQVRTVLLILASVLRHEERDTILTMLTILLSVIQVRTVLLILASVLRHEERDTILTMLTILLSVVQVRTVLFTSDLGSSTRGERQKSYDANNLTLRCSGTNGFINSEFNSSTQGERQNSYYANHTI